MLRDSATRSARLDLRKSKMDGKPSELENAIREAMNGEDFSGATKLAIEGYGPELLGFLLALLKDEDEASDVFSQVCENVWQGIKGFRWNSSLRTWVYSIARNAHNHHVQEGYRRKRQ